MRRVVSLKTAVVALLFSGLFSGVAYGGDAAYKVYGKETSLKQVQKDHQAELFEIESKKYQIIKGLAEQAFLDAYWAKKAKASGKSTSAARNEYMAKYVKVSEKEAKETWEKFKDHPQLSKLSKDEQMKQVKEYLKDKSSRDLIQSILDTAYNKKDLVIAYPKPQEPIYEVKVTKDDPLHYGPKSSDTKPMGCKLGDCPITVVEYSEFQCPFCSRVLPDVKRLLADYKGKVVWAVRDFPLGFHDRARPAALAAKCAANQGKYWGMYELLFKNQRELTDANFEKFAGKLKLNKAKFKKCLKGDPKALALIEKNYRSGAALGVTGTPAFFINGRRISGAQPYGKFKEIFDEEIAKKK